MGYVNGHNYGYNLHQLGYDPYNYGYTSPIYKAQLNPQDDQRARLWFVPAMVPGLILLDSSQTEDFGCLGLLHTLW